MDTHVTSLTVLDLGRADIDMGVVMAPGDLDGVWAVCAFPGYLVELTDGRRVLIDTGPNRRHIDEPMYEFRGTEFGKHLVPRLAAVDDLRNRLGELGYAEADIDIVVLTHNHFDHAGNVADFPDAEIIIHRADYEIGLDHARNGRPGGIPETSLDGRPLNYRIIDGDEQIVPGLTLLHTPGHSPGHLSVAIELPETGLVILAIDAIYSRFNRERGNYKIGADPAASTRSAARLIALAESRDALLIYGHDPDQWPTLRHAPDHYC